MCSGGSWENIHTYLMQIILNAQKSRKLANPLVNSSWTNFSKKFVSWLITDMLWMIGSPLALNFFQQFCIFCFFKFIFQLYRYLTNMFARYSQNWQNIWVILFLKRSQFLHQNEHRWWQLSFSCCCFPVLLRMFRNVLCRDMVDGLRSFML